MHITLRDYQDASVVALKRELSNDKFPLCVLPTGAGKSLVLAALIADINEPVLVLSHVKELLQQDSRILSMLAPKLDQGFFVAGLGEKNARAQAVFGSVQSVYRSLGSFTTRRALLLIDEAHLCPRKADAMYAAVFSHFAASPRVGFTATDTRMDSGSLIDGEGAWFDCVAYRVEPKELIDRGFLVPLTGLLPAAQADLAGVGSRAGDFVAEQAEQAVIKTLSLPEAVAAAKIHAKGRKAWLVFAAGIEHAHKVLAALRADKVSAEIVTSETPNDERTEIIERFKAGEFRALVNVGVLTTGFDAPLTDCIISLRPTKSQVLWQQMLGRGMRIAAQKTDCLLLDFVGNLDRMGGVGVVLETKDFRTEQPEKGKKKGKREAEREDPQLYAASTTDPMLTGKLFSALVKKVSFFVVKSKRYPGKSILVGSYDLQDEFGRAISARSFICIEYEGGARSHAMRWFSRRGLSKDRAPTSAAAGLLYARALPSPREVHVRYERAMSCFLIEHEVFEALN